MAKPEGSMTEQLIDKVLDALANARNGLRVSDYKNEANGSFFLTLVVELDPPTYARLCAEAEAQERSPAKLVRRYIVAGLRDCLSDDVEEPAA
jgi:hypothetical protein